MKKTIIYLSQIIKNIGSYFFGVSLLRILVAKTDSLFLQRMLITKYIRVLSKRKAPFEEIECNKQAMIFEDNFNKFNVFNMCYVSDVLGKTLYAVSMGCYPIFQILDFEGENYYNTFFEPLNTSGFTVKNTDLKKTKYNSGNPHFFMTPKECRVYHLLYNKFFIIRKEIKLQFEQEYQRVRRQCGIKGNLIGCVVRGTDYLLKEPSGHPIQPDIEKLIKKLKEQLTVLDYIYLATEEKKIVEKFEKEFGDKIIISDSCYYDGLYTSENINISEYSFERDNDKFRRGFEYYQRIYILSHCDGYIGGMSGATRIAQIMAGDNWKIKNIINLGVYS